MALTTTDFLKDVRQRGQIPSLVTDGISAPELEVVTDEGLLRLASGELRTWMAPKLLESRGEWLVASKDFALSATRRYRIPTRAAGGSLRTLFWLPAGTTETVELAQVDASEEPRARGDFRVEGAFVVLLNPNIVSGTLRMAYHVRPGTLVLPGACLQVASFSGTNTIVCLAALPVPGISTGAFVDLVKSYSPYDAVALDMEIGSAGNVGSNANLIMASALPVDIARLDYVCPTGTTCILPLPDDWWELFAQRVAARALEVAGLGKEAKAAYDTLEGLLEGLSVVTARERVQGSRRKVRNTSMWGG